MWWTCQLIFKSILLKSKVVLWREDTIEFVKEILNFFILFCFDTDNAILLSIQKFRVRTHLNNRVSLVVHQICCYVRWNIFQNWSVNFIVKSASSSIWLVLWFKFSMDSSSWLSWMNSPKGVFLWSYDMIGVTLSKTTEEFVLVVFPIMWLFFVLSFKIDQNVLFTMSVERNCV